MRTRCERWMVFGILVLSGCAPKVDPAAEEEAVRSVAARYLERAQAGDAAGIAELFASDGAWYPSTFPVGVGPQGVGAAWAENFAFAPPPQAAWTPDRFDVAASGDLAVEHGSWRGSYGGGRYVTVYAKQDGAWKILSDVSTRSLAEGGAPRWAQEQLDDWYAAYNSRDAQGLAALYAADAVVGDVRGRAAIISMFRDDWAASPRECVGGFDDFVVVGTLATGRGRDTCRETAADGSVTLHYSNWLTVYEQGPDGSWLATRDRGEEVGG